MPKLHRSARPARSVTAMVALRGRLLDRLTRRRPTRARLETLATQLADVLRARLADEPPRLCRIDLDTTPDVLAQIVRYEAVHAIRGLADLRRRLAADRRCYALFTDALPGAPLAFIEVAFTRGICGDVSTLLDTQSPVMDPETCDCAMFYSISSCHSGLRGIPFGNLLIRLVVERLQQELPGLRTFATVSPVPGFRDWITDLAKRQGGTLLEAVNALDNERWPDEMDMSNRLEEALLPLCAAYLVGAKRGEEPLDPVARFHLGNGAVLQQIHWLGDRTAAGFKRSAGIVANYLYDLPSVDSNRKTFASTHAVIASSGVARLAQEEWRRVQRSA
jgi:malonyl-CoA decarboxylase